MWIDRQDLLYTIRSARREPLLSIIAVVALSLGVGLNAGVFTLLNAMFLNAPTQINPATFVQLYPGMKAGSREPDKSLRSPPKTMTQFERNRLRSSKLPHGNNPQQSSSRDTGASLLCW
jgi:hypothetical protein